MHHLWRIDYEYTWQNQPRNGQHAECCLVSAAGVYCQGVNKSLARSWSCGGGVDPAVVLKEMQYKFNDGTLWKMAKVVLANGKREYTGSPLNMCTDMHKTTLRR